MADAHQNEPSPTEIEPRRMPKQARSKERVERILDAAAQLLVEKGYSAVKTNHIAKRAGVSIGSVYQFFPNRFAIFHALGERYRVRIISVLSRYIGPNAPNLPWEEAFDKTISALAKIWREEWHFFAVSIAIMNTAELREPDDEFKYRVLTQFLLPFHQKILPNTPETTRIKVAGIVFETFSLLLDTSIRTGEDGEQDAEIVEELRILVKSYVNAHVAIDRSLADSPAQI